MSQPSLDQPWVLLGGLSPNEFMQRYWQRQPLLIRQALPDWQAPVGAEQVRRLAQDPDVESRFMQRVGSDWHLDHGPFSRLPERHEPDYTVLIQGVDLHIDSIAQLRDSFRFVADARLDDVMISLAGPGGGVGPHFDSYDVFLLQAHGRRRWQYGRQHDLSLRDDLPVKILRHFEPEHTVDLAPGDMLYLPPHIAHDGVALDADCLTYSIGFRAPTLRELASITLELALEQLAEADHADPQRYTDAGEPATRSPAQLPDRLLGAAQNAVESLHFDRKLVTDALGRWLTEPKAHVIFEQSAAAEVDLTEEWPSGGILRLDRRTRLMYRDQLAWINGEPVMGEPSPWLQQLADHRQYVLPQQAPDAAAREQLQDWLDAGWLTLESP